MVGKTLMDRYRLDAEIGRGGMGVVYRAHDTVLERSVAVKVLSTSTSDPEMLKRWRHEAQAAAKLSHPNIVAVHDAGESNGSPFIIMELVDGTPLSETGTLGYREIVAVGRQLSAALAHAHDSGIIHRDIKPANILVKANGSLPTVKLADLGVAHLTQSTQLTREGELIGTASYLAPEQALGQEIDGRADLYSLGVVLYELATGRLPFEGEDPLAVVSQHLYAPLVPPGTWREDIPSDLEQIIMKLLAKDANDRFANADEVGEVLESARLEVQKVLDEVEAPTTDPVVLLDRLARGRLTGRREQLQQLRELWLRALRGQSHLALISGEPGVGKTRLSRELMVLARLQGAPVLTGGCYEFEATTPYLPWVEGLRQWVNDVDVETLRTTLGSTAAELARLAPEIESKLGPQPAPPELSAQQERMRLFDAFSRFLQNLSARRGLLVYLDDLHWADHGTLQLLHYLMRNLRDDRLLVLGAYREVELDRAHPLSAALVEWNRERLATRIPLGRLSLDDSQRMLAAMFGQEKVSDEFASAIHSDTEGNPFFVEEVIKSLIEHGQIYREEGRWQRKEVADLTIPQSIKAAIGRRLNRLGEECTKVLHTAAALGKVFEFDTLAAVSRTSEDALLDALDEATAAQLIRVEGRETFAFTHDKIREVLHDELNPIRQRRLHQQIGECLESFHRDDTDAHAADLAYHFSQGSDLGKGLHYSLCAARQAVKVYAMEEALEHYDRAYECAEALERDGELSTIVEQIARVHDAKGDQPQAAQQVERALTLETDPQRKLQLHALAAEYHVSTVNPLGRDHAEKARKEIDPEVDPQTAARALNALGRYAHHDGKYDEALELLAEAGKLAEAGTDLNLKGWVYAYTAAVYQHLGRYRESIAWARKAIELGEKHNLIGWVAAGHEFIAEDSFGMGDFHTALESAAIDREIGERIGALDRVGWSFFSEAYAYRGLGRLSRGLESARKCLTLAKRLGEVRLQALGHTIKSLLHAARGEFDEALADGKAGVAIGDRIGSLFLSSQGDMGLMNLYMSRGDWDAAHEAQRSFEKRLEHSQNVNLRLITRSWAAELHVISGRLDDAERCVEEILALARKCEAILWEGCALRTRAWLRLAQGRMDEARQAVDEAVAIFEKHDIEHELARALMARTAIMDGMGDAAGANTERTRAEALFEKCEAPIEVERQRAAAFQPSA